MSGEHSPPGGCSQNPLAEATGTSSSISPAATAGRIRSCGQGRFLFVLTSSPRFKDKPRASGHQVDLSITFSIEAAECCSGSWLSCL